MNAKANDQTQEETWPAGDSSCAIGFDNEQKKDTSNCVLLLDDNPYFRPIVVNLLNAHGYEVWQARNPTEADAFLATADPALAIVDCHLPGRDGISWIARVRDCGKTWPIVFISGSWFDEKTFAWLRNILKVSRMVQKPIDPDLFLEIIEEALHKSHLIDSTPPLIRQTPVNYSDLFKLYAKRAKVEIEQSVPSPELSPQALQELKQVRKKLITQNTLGAARSTFLKHLPGIWHEFLTQVRDACRSTDRLAWQQAKDSTQSIKEILTSYNLLELTEIVSQMGDLLGCYNSSSRPERLEAGRTEISQLLEAGTIIVSRIAAKETHEELIDLESSVNLLLISDIDEYRQWAESLDVNLHIESAITSFDAVLKAREGIFDAAIIDLNLDIAGGHLELTKALRSIHKDKALPFLFIDSTGGSDELSALIYSGCSAILELPVTRQSLDAALRRLIGQTMKYRPRILSVDTDELLSLFVKNTLAEHKFEVQCLNEPTRILEVMADFRPDLILLDVLKPESSGFDVCRLLRSNTAWSKIPIIFLTGKSDLRSRAEAFRAGGTDFLTKPLLVDELVTRVKSHLALLKKERNPDIDRLTGVFSHTRFKKEGNCARARSAQRPISLSVLEVEDFETLDRTYGAQAKEQVLSALGNLLSLRFRPDDVRGRWSENQLAIIVYGESAERIAPALKLLQQEFTRLNFMASDGQIFHATLRVGAEDFSPAPPLAKIVRRASKNAILADECTPLLIGQSHF